MFIRYYYFSFSATFRIYSQIRPIYRVVFPQELTSRDLTGLGQNELFYLFLFWSKEKA